MPAVVAGTAVILAQQVDEQLADVALYPHRELDLPRLVRKVVQEQDGIVAPVITDGEHRRVAGLQDFEIAPADFRHFLAHAYNALSPVQHRLWITPLIGGVDVLEAIGTTADNGYDRFFALGEASIRLGRPLHRRPATCPLGQ